MIQSRRFGKRLALPSTAQIIHELRALMAAEAAGKQTGPDAAAKTAVEQLPDHAIRS